MPIIPEVKETFEKLIKLHETKNTDYTGDKGVFYNFQFAEFVANQFPDSRDKVYATIVGVKLARLSVVLTNSPNHESVLDTFDDAMVYLCLWKADYIINGSRTISDESYK